jgi:crossover junction endodeoxyribonuclease RusA
MTVSFDVLGTPKPQGSNRAFVVAGKARITSASKDNGWRDSVARTAAAIDHEQFTGPVGVNITFRMPRPKSRPKTHHGWHSTSPDIDKLLRSCLDAITSSGLWKDDGQVAAVSMHAIETTAWTGASFTIYELSGRAGR